MVLHQSVLLFQMFVSPAIFISSGGLLMLTMNTRLLGIVSKIRLFNKELQNAIRINDTNEIILLENQIQQDLHRANKIRKALICCVLGSFGNILSCLFIGFHIYLSILFYIAVYLFVVSLIMLMISLMFFFNELLISLHPIKEDNILRKTISFSSLIDQDTNAIGLGIDL